MTRANLSAMFDGHWTFMNPGPHIRKPDINFLGLCRLAQTFLLLLQAFISLCKFEKDKKSPKSLCQVSWCIDLCSAMYITYTCNFFLMTYSSSTAKGGKIVWFTSPLLPLPPLQLVSPCLWCATFPSSPTCSSLFLSSSWWVLICDMPHFQAHQHIPTLTAMTMDCCQASSIYLHPSGVKSPFLLPLMSH